MEFSSKRAVSSKKAAVLPPLGGAKKPVLFADWRSLLK
jgi:hypothetical protein